MKLGAELKRFGLGGYLANVPSSVGFLTGFFEGPGERFSNLVVNQDGDFVMVCPALSVNQAKRAGIEDVRSILDGVDPIETMAGVFKDLGISGHVGVDDLYPGIHLMRLMEGFPDHQFRAAGKVFGAVSRTKGAEALKWLHTTGAAADAAYLAVLPQIKAGMSEVDLAKLLADAMTKEGGVPAFGIIAAGPNGAECHHHTDETVLKSGDVVIMDFGCDVGGYKSDITRTVSIGEPSDPRAREVYRIVYKAHMAARAAIKPGVKAGEIDAAARNVITEAGYGEYFTHRLGHGLGREVHEEPYILPNSHEEIKVGDVFSIEPGIYLPGEFGVRIENIVTATATGHESFNAEPPAELPIV